MRMGRNWVREKAPQVAAPAEAAPRETAPAPGPAVLSEEDRSKDAFFVELGRLVEAMRARHGKDFAAGTLLLAARFVVNDKTLAKEPS